jgi:hypothetical protein
LVEDPKWELAILATVQGFYEKLLQDIVSGEVPVPAGLDAISLQQGNGDVRHTLSQMHRWLRLLDLAISPASLRQAFSSDTDPEIAEAMLRYFTRKKDLSDANRDKADIVVTFLYRHPRVPGQWERRGYGLDGALPLSPFEIALIEILSETETPALAEEQLQLLRSFHSLKEEAERFQDLDALLDSEIIPRARALKQALGSSFYHPGALATLALYNVEFGKRFNRLFLAAAGEIKSVAEALQQQGGSILGTVDGVDITVEHVAVFEESELLRSDYGSALQRFRRVSKLKKSLERRPPIRRKAKLAQPPAAATAPTPAAPRPSPVRPVIDVDAMRSAVTPQQISNEEGKLLRIEESIRVFVRVADPKFRQIVPMRFFNLTLAPAEADAYCADYLEEKSLRSEVARLLLRIVALLARMTTELGELKRAENSPSLRQLHTDSLIVLLEAGRTVSENAARVLASAKQQGNGAETISIQDSLRKLDECSALAIRELSGSSEKKGAGAGAD